MFSISRRLFIGTSAALACSLNTGRAAVTTHRKSLTLHNVHTAEYLDAVFERDGALVQKNLGKFDYLLRDHRQNAMREMDTGLLVQLYELQQRLGVSEPIDVLSGYRTPATNNLLRKRSSKVARKSYHMVGRAIDFRIPGVATRLIRDTAIDMQLGGVGYYRKSDFVHLDTGPVRTW